MFQGTDTELELWWMEFFSWLNDGSWDINVAYKPQTMVGYLVCKNEKLGVSLVMEDIVYNEENVFLRKVEIYNSTPHHRDIKLFFIKFS
jgi:hypothetical protein